MENTWHLYNLIVALGLLEECVGFPIHLGAEVPLAPTPLVPLALGAATLLVAVVLLLGCVCCRQQKGFQEFTNSVVSSQNNLAPAPAPGASELTLFPPLGATLSDVQFEPLPDIQVVVAAAARRKPAAFGNTPHHGHHDWFLGPQENFSRHQLQYVRELGRGWFGKVVEGKAKDIVSGQSTSKVVVKILHEDATPTDQSYFLHEAKPFRDLKHSNILRLVGRCLETHPFLLLFEDCPLGTLKTFLLENKSTAENLREQGVLLEMACGVAGGLHHMLGHGYVHTDLATRNCLVSSDLTVKVGDYGTSIETFKDEYYCVGDLAIPIRWVAPETLSCTDTTIETKEVTASANVWSLAVVLWEICEFGKLPYSDLTDEEVIERVLCSGSTCLPFPAHSNQPHVHNLYHLMKICWVESAKRPPIGRIVAMLQHLHQHRHSPAHTSANNNNNSTTSLDDFERRWELSKPNTVPKIDNEVGTGTVSMHCSPARAAPRAPRQRRLSFEDSVKLQYGAHGAHSPQLSASSSSGGEFYAPSFSHQKSPSMQNLRGSVDELNSVDSKEMSSHEGKLVLQTSETVKEESDFDSWLKGMDTSTEDDARFVRNVSEAIRDLDAVLAQEKTSSSSQSSSTHHSPSQVTTRDGKPEMQNTSPQQNVVLDFRLGQFTTTSPVGENVALPSGGNEMFSLTQHRFESSGSDTEDETWRIRIERGEFSEKVKEKSKSVADLMVLTHIEYSDGSDSDTTLDLESCNSSFKKNGAVRRSFHKKPLQSSASVAYGSEGNIHNAVLGEDFQETIKRLQEALRDGSKLEAIPDASLSYVSMSSNEAVEHASFLQNSAGKDHFFAKQASEIQKLRNDASETSDRGTENLTNSICGAKTINCKEGGWKTDTVPEMQVAHAEEVGDEHEEEDAFAPISSQNLEHFQSINEDVSLKTSLEPLEEIFVPKERNLFKMVGEPMLSSTPVSSKTKLTGEIDSSLLCSMTLSSIDSQSGSSNSTCSSSLERPMSPIPGDLIEENDVSCVTLGPFEDSTLDYFKGLKTAFPVIDKHCDDMDSLNGHEIDLDEHCIETWDKFLEQEMQPKQTDFPSFSDISFCTKESESRNISNNTRENGSGILGSSFERSSCEKAVIVESIGTSTSHAAEEEPFVVSVEDFSEDAQQCDFKILQERENNKDVFSEKSCLISEHPNRLINIPSVNVIGATPISSGRSSPSESGKDEETFISKDSHFKHVKNVQENNILGEVCDNDIKKWSFNELESSPKYVTVGFAVPQISTDQKFDSDLPCCDHLNEKNFNFQRSNFEIFPLEAGLTNGLSSDFINELSDCYISNEMDRDMIGKEFKPVIPLFSKGFVNKEVDGNGDIEDEDDFGLGVAKNLTPDDERSSDSGFRDKGSLSESCEDACDEKYNLEDIEAELEEAFAKGVFNRHDSPTSTKGLELECDVVDESFSVTLTDVEKQREMRNAEISKDPCHRLDELLSGGDTHVTEPLCVVSSMNDSERSFFGASPQLSPVVEGGGGGWYLHPQPGQDGFCGEPISGNDSSYFSFSLDEEFVNAIRNELREKLPCAQKQNEESQPHLSDEEQSDEELDLDDSPSKERANIMIHYKTYPASLSPIPEERESITSEACSPIGGPKTSSLSEQFSPVFAFGESCAIQGETFMFQGEDEVRLALSECPAEVDGDLSDDTGDCDFSDEPTDLEAVNVDFISKSDLAHNVITGVSDEEDEDVLVVNTITNEATLLESPKFHSKFSVSKSVDPDRLNIEDFVPNYLSVAGTYQLPETRYCSVERDPVEMFQMPRPSNLQPFTQKPSAILPEEDCEVMTPDSITGEKCLSSEVTEDDSALGLAPSEIMTPDSLAGESPWSAEEFHSETGRISETFSSGSHSDYSSVHPLTLEEVEPTTFLGKEISPPGTICSSASLQDDSLKAHIQDSELSETTHSTEDSESSASYSTNSIIATSSKARFLLDEGKELNSLMNICAKSELQQIKDSNSCVILDTDCFLLNERKFSDQQHTQETVFCFPTQDALLAQSPLPLKEIASKILRGSEIECSQTIAFNLEKTVSGQKIPTSSSGFQKQWTLVNPPKATNKGSQKSQEDCDSVKYKVGRSDQPLAQPLQTLAFSDCSQIDNCNYSDHGRLVLTSVLTPLTPNEELPTPGTLAFNESPVSPTVTTVFDVPESDEAESHLMSTSFISTDDNDQYAPDWESSSDGGDSESTSSSGEFIWKDGDREASVKAVQAMPDSEISQASGAEAYTQALPEFPMSSILEEDEDGTGTSSGPSDSEDDADFVPSAWDSQATPSRSALRSPDKKAEQKKNVSFKRQRYHCVYEYPRELSDSDGSEYAESPSRRRTWDLDNSNYSFHDWELADTEGGTDASGVEDLKPEDEESAQSTTSQRLFDFYKLSSIDYTFGSTMISDDGEFFISSSAQPFHSIGEACAGGSEFFPGRALAVRNESDTTDILDPTSTISTESSNGQGSSGEEEQWRPAEDMSDSDSSDTNMITASEGSLSHQKSIDSNSSSTPMVTANGSSKSSEDLSMYHSVPSNQELRLDSGSDSPLSELSPPSPLSPMSPSHGLGELRHTRDRLKLDLPTNNTAFILSTPSKRRSVEQVKGEASLLDGGELEDSGYKSGSTCILSSDVL